MITLERLKELFELRGSKLFWRYRKESDFKTMQEYKRWNKLYAGKEAGKKGKVSIDNRQYNNDQVIFSLHTGINAFDPSTYRSTKVELTKEFVAERFTYKEGRLIRRPRPIGDCYDFGDYARTRSREGSNTGDRKAYKKVSIMGKQYYEHRLIYLLHYGTIPVQIDHIDHDTTNNRIENLRDVTHSQNGRNQKLRSTNKSGYNGVHYDKKSRKWAASITVDRKAKNIGYYTTIEEAIKARKKAEEKYFHANHGK